MANAEPKRKKGDLTVAEIESITEQLVTLREKLRVTGRTALTPSPEAEATRTAQPAGTGGRAAPTTAPPRPHHCGVEDFASQRKPMQICVPFGLLPKIPTHFASSVGDGFPHQFTLCTTYFGFGSPFA